ncbi:hypothetical protein YUWDRAFT_06890 [Streptomyces sp. AmelKG-D3]|nr:hypothetical protein YUWDRAFT_06890 [Streptomyces sp. AmelKG-D3]
MSYEIIPDQAMCRGSSTTPWIGPCNSSSDTGRRRGTSPGTARGPRPPPSRGSSAWVRGVVGWRAYLHSGAGVVARVIDESAGLWSEQDGACWATGRGSSVRPEWAGWAVDRDARLTLWAHSRCAASRESCSDLVFSVTRSGRHLSYDASCGVRGDSGAGEEGRLTCSFRTERRGPSYRHQGSPRAGDAQLTHVLKPHYVGPAASTDTTGPTAWSPTRKPLVLWHPECQVCPMASDAQSLPGAGPSSGISGSPTGATELAGNSGGGAGGGRPGASGSRSRRPEKELIVAPPRSGIHDSYCVIQP